MSYPTDNTPIPSYAGTALQGDIDHAAWHATTNTDLDGAKTVLGVNGGTAVLKNFTVGNFAARTNSETFGSVTINGGTANTLVMGTPTLSAPTISGAGTMSGTLINGVINNTSIGTSAITGGTITGGLVSCQPLRLGAGGDLTIVGSAITVTHSYHKVDTVAGTTASSDLGTISGGTVGDILVLQSLHADRDVVVKNVPYLRIGSDFTLTNPIDKIILMKASTGWTGLSTSDNG